MAAGTSEQHARGEDGLGDGAALLRKSARNHGLSGGSIRGFAKSHESPREQEEKKTGSEAAGKRCGAPEEDANRDNGLAAETVGEEAERDACDGENDEKKRLQGAELGVRGVKMIAQQRNQRDEDLAGREVDKIDQSKYSKKTNLVGRERNGLRGHAEFAR